MNDSKNCLAYLLEGVERKRVVSIKEFYKTDLNRTTKLDNVNVWYSHLVQMIERNPPEKFVRGLKIYEDYEGVIKAVEYDYFETIQNEALDPAFTFYYGN